MNTRRQFLITAPLGLVATACRGTSPSPASSAPPAQTTPGAPVAFGTSPAVGPEVTPTTFIEAEKLAQVSFTDADRAMLVASWPRTMAPMLERRTGPRTVTLPDTLAPGMVWNPAAAAGFAAPAADRFVRSNDDPGPLPSSDVDIAFSPVTSLSRWIERRQLTSERLTSIYLDRIAQYDGKLRSVITLTREHALQQARAADAEIAAGRYRGPLHGIPYGVKDLLDTAGIATTYGSAP